MSTGEPNVARCEECGDVIPVKSPHSDAIEPIRSGESCECGAAEFRVLSEAEVADLPAGSLSGRGTR